MGARAARCEDPSSPAKGRELRGEPHEPAAERALDLGTEGKVGDGKVPAVTVYMSMV
jgi:hypothetical protein